MRERTNRVRYIPLSAVLLAAGAALDRYDKARWHTQKGVISVTGMKFFNWNSGVGGGGAIDLVVQLYGLDFKGAVAWLRGRFPGDHAAPNPCAVPKPNLQLPLPHSGKLSTVKRYLQAERRISPAVLDRLIQSDDLYADNHANAVFLLRGKNNIPVGAELRGTGCYTWRGMAPGSRKNLGFFSIHDAHIDGLSACGHAQAGIILCESAIDAISCSTIHPRHWCISTAGARPNPSWLPPLIHQSAQLYCGFDADPTGDAMAHAMIDLYPAVKRLRPSRHDWNDLLRSRS